MATTSMPFSITISSATNPGTRYTIKQGADGVVYCSCPAWKFQKAPVEKRSCKHIRKVMKALA